MTNKIIPVEREGGGKILTPGNPDNIHPLTELRIDIEETKDKFRDKIEELKRIQQDQDKQLRADMRAQYDVLEAHIQDVDKRHRRDIKEVIATVQGLEKMVVETGFKT